VKKNDSRKTPCRCCTDPKPRPEISDVRAGVIPAEGGSRGLLIPPGFITGAARGILKALEAGDEAALQLAGLPLLELGRRVQEGREFEARIRSLEARIKALEESAARK